MHWPCRNEYFTGRKELLDQIENAFNGSTGLDASKVVVCYGLGGVGKTQIAVEFVYSHQFDYQFICWIPSDAVETIKMIFEEFAKMLGLNIQSDHTHRDNEEMKQHVMEWLMENPKWLLVFDNANN